MIQSLLIFSFLSFFCQDVGASSSICNMHIDGMSDSYRQDVDSTVFTKGTVQSLVYDVDGIFNQDELSYLTGLSVDQNIEKKDIINALFYLRQSGKFKTIFFSMTGPYNSLTIRIRLVFFETLRKVKFSGFLRGKDRFKDSYLIDVGEVFDKQKHRYCLDLMENSLKEEGYFSAKIVDRLDIDTKDQSVIAQCCIHKGHRFRIHKAEVVFDSVGSVAHDDIMKLTSRFEVVCGKKLQGKYYCKDVIDAASKKIKQILEYCGCIDFDIKITQQFNDVTQEVDVVFHISLQRKREFVFWGNAFFTREDIVQRLLLYGKSTWHFPGSLIVDEIEQLYKSKGFYRVHVSVREDKDHVFCFITEGARCIISGVSIQQNHNFSSAMLTKEIFHSVLRAKYFDKDMHKKALDHLVKFYKQAGFWDVKIVKEGLVPAKKEHSFDMHIVVDEGSKRVLGDAIIPGYPDIQDHFKTAWCRYCNKGFDVLLLQEQKQWLTAYLRNKGFLKVTVEYVYHERSGSPGVIDVTWNISLAESAIKFGKTIILGNQTIAHSLLQNEICYDQGDVWDKQKLEKTLQNFRRLSVFDSVRIYPGKETDEYSCKPIFIKLVEADRYEVRTRFGMQQVGRDLQLRRGFTYKIGGTVSIKNPFSVADQCLFEADVTRFYRDISATYVFPWLFQRKINCQFKLYDNLYNQPVYIGSQCSLYKATQQGFLWNMLYPKGPLVVSGSTGLEFLGVYQADQPDLETIIDYDHAFLGKRIPYIFIEPTLMWQKIDNALNPCRGHSSFISCRGMFDLDSKTSFFKVLVEHSRYFCLAPKATLALRVRLGHVFNRCFNQINPIGRFYLGGASTIRGYDRDYCPPLGCLTIPIEDQYAGLPPQANDLWRYAPQGGRTLFNLNTEFRCIMYKNLGVALFTDIGALFKDSIYEECTKWTDNFFGGSGFGFRYDTPIGPLRFDVGFKWKITQPDFQSRCVWYLTLGQAF